MQEELLKEIKSMKKSQYEMRRDIKLLRRKSEITVFNENNKPVGIVEWNDNLLRFVKDYPSDPFPNSEGITRLEDGQLVYLDFNNASIISMLDGIKMILEFDKHYLLFKLDLVDEIKELFKTNIEIKDLISKSPSLMRRLFHKPSKCNIEDWLLKSCPENITRL